MVNASSKKARLIEKLAFLDVLICDEASEASAGLSAFRTARGAAAACCSKLAGLDVLICDEVGGAWDDMHAMSSAHSVRGAAFSSPAGFIATPRRCPCASPSCSILFIVGWFEKLLSASTAAIVVRSAQVSMLSAELFQFIVEQLTLARGTHFRRELAERGEDGAGAVGGRVGGVGGSA